jgi:hypothetical protein
MPEAKNMFDENYGNYFFFFFFSDLQAKGASGSHPQDSDAPQGATKTVQTSRDAAHVISQASFRLQRY